jgi:hypothetical protein
VCFLGGGGAGGVGQCLCVEDGRGEFGLGGDKRNPFGCNWPGMPSCGH